MTAGGVFSGGVFAGGGLSSGSLLSDGPDTVTEGEFDTGRPSGVQIETAAEQSDEVDSDTVTSASEFGRTVMIQL